MGAVAEVVVVVSDSSVVDSVVSGPEVEERSYSRGEM